MRIDVRGSVLATDPDLRVQMMGACGLPHGVGGVGARRSIARVVLCNDT